jgi:ribonucleoside-diphosphate reductase beta chain
MYLKNSDTEKRYSIFPIKNQDLWDAYKAAEKQTWVAEEVNLAQDDYNSLTDDEKFYLKNILAFFTISDGLVIDNLCDNVIDNVDIAEAKYYYNHQMFIEQVHANGYALLIDTYIEDPLEKNNLFNSMLTNDAVRDKAEWAENWLNNGTFVEKLVAFACVEGIAFSSVFAGVFWFRSRNKMPGLAEMNELILRDESFHYEFALQMFKNYVKDEYKPSKERVREVILSCFETEKTFVEKSLPDGLQGMTKQMMIEYVEFVTDIVLNDFLGETKFNTKNPLDFMKKIGLSSKNNFFERRTGGGYTRVDIPTSNLGIFDDADF